MLRSLMQLCTVVWVTTFLTVSLSVAQDEGHRIDLSKVPLRGASVQNFVPAGWRPHEQVEGDLNKDSRADIVLRLIEDIPADSEGVPSERNQALMVLFREADGRLLRAGFSGNLLLCTMCYGMLGGEDGNVSITIEKGVLIVNQLWGARDAVDQTHRFRYDDRPGRFLLIGQDIENRDRISGHTTLESSNYLTGQQVTEKRKFTEEGTEETVLSTSRKRIPKTRKFLEEM
jgi:hypothetical protein